MDESAVKQIQETAIDAARDRAERLPKGVIALPENYKLHDTEKYERYRRRFRGSLATSSLEDFAAYVLQNSGGDAVGFVDPDKLAANVFFNLLEQGGPGHADWKASLQLKPTAAYASLIAVEGKPLSQASLVEWVEDWNTNVVSVFAAGEESIGLARAIAAIRKIEIKQKRETTHEVETNREARSALDEIEARATQDTPRLLSFECEPYVGLSRRTFMVRVSILTSGTAPMLTLRTVGKDEIPEQLAQEFKRLLDSKLAGVTPLTIGTFTA